jgi:hypothetical protein
MSAPASTPNDQVAEAQVAEVAAAVEADHAAPGKFSLKDHIKSGGIKMPRLDVTVFTDVEATWNYDQAKAKYDDLRNAHVGSMTGPPEEESAPLEAEMKECGERIWNSRIVFHMRGMAPKLTEATIRKSRIEQPKRDAEEHWSWVNIEWARLSTASIEFMESGEVWDRTLTFEEMEELLTDLYRPEADNVVTMAQVLALGVTLSDRRSDAGFPGGSAELPAQPGDPVPAEGGGGDGTITG